MLLSFFDAILPAAPAHTFVFVVATDLDLVALGDHLAVLQAGVDDGLFAAAANGFDLGDAVRDLKQPLGALEKLGEEIRPQTEAQHRGVAVFGNIFHLIHLGGGEELALVADDDVDVVLGVQRHKAGVDILVAAHHVRHGGKADAALDHRHSHPVFVGVVVPVVQVRLDEPDVVALFFVVKAGHQGVGGFGGGHGPEFKVQF